MKITSSTSRISISGTTFISDTIPPLPPTSMPMSHLASLSTRRGGLSHPARKPLAILLPCFQFRGNQPHFIDARAVHDVDGARHLEEQHVVIALHESHFFRAVLEDLFDARTQALPGGVLVVDLQLSIFEDLHHHGLVLELLVLLLVR